MERGGEKGLRMKPVKKQNPVISAEDGRSFGIATNRGKVGGARKALTGGSLLFERGTFIRRLNGGRNHQTSENLGLLRILAGRRKNVQEDGIQKVSVAKEVKIGVSGRRRKANSGERDQFWTYDDLL